jgi:hypothetical protein
VDWIEQIFHVSPDGGNGMIELAIYVILGAALLLGLNYMLKRFGFRMPRRARKPQSTGRGAETGGSRRTSVAE